jgi:hypothetical protein
MKRRCGNLKDPSYCNYGGRGISVCEEWENSFISFKDWAFTHGYKIGLTLDRIDNDGDYEPSNCQWVPKIIQESNKRSNHNVTFKGQTKTLTQWANEYGISLSTLRFRLKKGFSFESALTLPIDSRFSRSQIGV